MKFKKHKIEIPDNKGHYIFMESEDIEYVNPISYISNLNINTYIVIGKEVLSDKKLELSDEIIQKYLLKNAIEEWNKDLLKFQSIDLPNNLFELLNAKSKREQIKSLKGLSLTSDELISFFFMAFDKYGFLYSQYKSEFKHKGLDESQLPKVIHMEKDGEINTIGETPLTKGQQKQVVEHRKVVVSKFIDKDDT